MSVITPKDCFHQPQVADLRLIACPGAEELTNLIDKHLVRWASEAGYQTDSFIIESACPRFQSGDAKGLVKESVRGDDIFIVVDPGNYSVTYKLFNYENHLSPDDHFANLKRLIQAVAGKAHRVSVIMPSLYGGRQHRRVSRESLDCAVALQELQAMGVKNIITFDAHDPRLMNAVPLMSFDNAMPTYQVLKNLLKKNPEISFDKDKFIVVSPDEGAMSRNMYFSSVLGCNLGMFYKRRDYTRVVNGRNPIVAHEYLGDSVEGKTVFVADDIIASGESMLEVATNLKERGAKRIIANATFPLFTSGLEKFDKAVTDGILDYVTGTSDALDTNQILDMMFTQNPDIGSVGLLYSLSEPNSEVPIADAKAYLDAKGVAYTEATANANDEVIAAASSLIADGVDAVFTPTDNIIMAAELAIYEDFIAAGIPHYTGADSFVRNGAFATCGVNYTDLGAETADLAYQAMTGGMDGLEDYYQVAGGLITVNSETAAALAIDPAVFESLGQVTTVTTTED